MPDEKEEARRLVATVGVHLAQHLNDDLFSRPEYRKWTNQQLLLATACLAAGFARAEDLPLDDFLLLCSTAYDLIRPIPKEPT